LHVLVLSSDHTRARPLIEAVKSKGHSVVLASSLGDLQSLLHKNKECVVLHDVPGFASPPREVLSVSVTMGVPVIVVAHEFDPAQWIELFHLGACDVLRGPVLPADLHRSIGAAASTLVSPAAQASGGAGEAETWRVRIRRWSRKLLQPLMVLG
jgi:DNA-binding NtrC family response regulator